MISPSDIVRSLAGRDAGELFYVLGLEDEYAFLADGKSRKLNKPKRKKLRHLGFEARGDPEFSTRLLESGKVTDRELRRALAEYKATREMSRGGE